MSKHSIQIVYSVQTAILMHTNNNPMLTILFLLLFTLLEKFCSPKLFKAELLCSTIHLCKTEEEYVKL